MSLKNIQPTSLDFEKIKNQLKVFLEGQSEFTDYDFEGSGLNILLDLLAYHTNYNGFYLNAAINEMFLSTARKRSSIVSHAAELGYVPSSSRAATAEISLTVIPNGTPSTLTVLKGQTFTSLGAVGDSYTFQAISDYTITPDSLGNYVFPAITIREGTIVTNSIEVDKSNLTQRFVIPNKRCDTSTLTVKVQTSSADSSVSTWTLAQDITEVNSESRVYFLQETYDGRFEIYFGDNNIGKAVDDGNIIIMEYWVSNGPNANGANAFSFSGTVDGNSNIQITTLSPAQGGSEKESDRSLKFNAPLAFTALNRAVTPDDYKAILRRIYGDIKSIAVWGGEESNPPVYGRVFIAIKPNGSDTVPSFVKENVLTPELKKFNTTTVQPIFIDPVVLNIVPKVNFSYDPNVTTKTLGELEIGIIQVIKKYNIESLTQFSGIFRKSELIENIHDYDESILSVSIDTKIKKLLIIDGVTSNSWEIDFRNSIEPSSLESLSFTLLGKTSFLEDDGNGVVKSFYMNKSKKTYISQNQGIIDYNSGKITLSGFSPSGSNSIEILARPSLSNIYPLREMLLEVLDNDITVSGSLETLKLV